jgi:hypothetical protein
VHSLGAAFTAHGIIISGFRQRRQADMLKLNFCISSVQLVGYGFMMAIPPLFLVDAPAERLQFRRDRWNIPLVVLLPSQENDFLRAIPDIDLCLF